jgi:hypothetical protein
MISIACMTMICFLLFNEWQIFQTPEIKKNTTVSTDPDKKPHITVNLDLTFPNTPCYMIDMVMRTTVNEADKDILIKSLTWQHSKADGEIVEKSFGEIIPFPKVNTTESETSNLIKDFFDNGHMC